MRRTIMFGAALALFAGTSITAATAGEVTARDADGQRPATLHEINALLRDLGEVADQLAIDQAAVAGSTIAALGASGARVRVDREAECRYGRSDGQPGYSTLDVRRVIRCAVGKWSVPGGYDKAVAVASCESGSDLLDHSTDGYTGTFQQSTRYWDGRRAAYNPVGWDKPLQHPAWHPRANVVVSIRMAHADGDWSDWSQGACA